MSDAEEGMFGKDWCRLNKLEMDVWQIQNCFKNVLGETEIKRLDRVVLCAQYIADVARAALQSKPVDVEGLKRPIPDHGCGCLCAGCMRPFRYNAFLDELTEEGYSICLSKNTNSDRQTDLSNTDERQQEKTE